MVEEFPTKFDKEVSLVVCLSMRTTHSDMWYIDSGASCNMTGVHENLIDLTQIGDVEVVLGDVGEAIVDSELVRTTLNGVSKQWVVL